MRLHQRYQAFLAHFRKHQPNPATELVYRNPFELLVAVILSAQCTDKRINMVTPALFVAYPTPATLAQASFDTLYPYLKSVSYPRAKTRHLLGMANQVMHTFEGTLPDNAGDLQRLPGVGRKTANVFLSVVHGKPTMPVDTHVMRVTKRIGLVSKRATTPLAIEQELVKHLPTHELVRAHHWLVLHGRYVCKAQRPSCATCPLTHACQYFATTSPPAAS